MISCYKFRRMFYSASSIAVKGVESDTFYINCIVLEAIQETYS